MTRSRRILRAPYRLCYSLPASSVRADDTDAGITGWLARVDLESLEGRERSLVEALFDSSHAASLTARQRTACACISELT